jgi:hypothetical protein
MLLILTVTIHIFMIPWIHYSTVDYFMISNELINPSIQYLILDEMVNLSDHLPVSLNVMLSIGEAKSTVAITNAKHSEHMNEYMIHSRGGTKRISADIIRSVTIMFSRSCVKSTSSIVHM